MPNDNKYAGKPDDKNQSASKGLDLVLMFRDDPQFKGGPTQAMVHPNEVANYANGGWQKK